MITPRTTTLVRTADLATFREAVVALAGAGDPLDARDRLVIVPTHAAAAHLTRAIEDVALLDCGAVVLPDLVTSSELVTRLAERLDVDQPVLADAEREVLLGVACRAAHAAGTPAPFVLRPGLIAEILKFYDQLKRHQKDVDTFERLALGLLEPGALDDRGAARLVAQTRFLVAAFREFEERCREHGLDEHQLRARLLQVPAIRPITHIVVTVADRAFDPHGLQPCDWDLLARLPGLQRLDLVVTDTVLAGALHERMHQLLPGIEEIRFESRIAASAPALVTSGAAVVQTSRDREEEVANFARRVKQDVRRGVAAALDRVALVVHQRLPYVYVAQEVLRSAGVPCQMFDALPLAGEPFAAALELVFSFVSGGFARAASLALLRSPYFRFDDPARVSAADLSALDRALSEGGYLGELDALDALIARWRASEPSRGLFVRALRAAEALRAAAGELQALRTPAAVASHVDVLLAFLRAHESLPGPDDPLRARQLRARSAILATLATLRDAYARFDVVPVEFDAVAALVRRWIDGQTFAPRVGDSGVHVTDAVSARFGNFEMVQLAGLIDGEWPDRPRRSIFYSGGVLRELGWPAEAERLDGARAMFRDLLRLPSRRLLVSTFTLEADAIVTPSVFVEEVAAAGLATTDDPPSPARIFETEALGRTPIAVAAASGERRAWAELRAGRVGIPRARPGSTAAHDATAFSLSALERYQDCPFKFFANDVLRLEEAPEDEAALSPRARGRFIHEVFQQFFAAWDATGQGAITTDRIDAARDLFASVADALLTRLPDADAALERTRLFGSAISVGIVDVVLGLEASRPADVRERWLEYRLEGDFSLGGDRRVPLKGVADRIDLLDGRRLRVIDYKSGAAPQARRALQVPIYALCARERLTERDGVPWTVEEASYVAFTGRRSVVPIVKPGADAEPVLGEARDRVMQVLAGVAAGEFPPRPYDDTICRWCAFSTVCRKDYVDDE